MTAITRRKNSQSKRRSLNGRPKYRWAISPQARGYSRKPLIEHKRISLTQTSTESKINRAMDIKPNDEDEIVDFLNSNEPHAGVPLDDPQYLLFQKYENADRFELRGDANICELRATDMGYDEHNLSIEKFNLYVILDVNNGDVLTPLITPNVGDTFLDDLDFWLSMSEEYDEMSQEGNGCLEAFFCEEMVMGMIRKNNAPTFTENAIGRCDSPPNPQKMLNAMAEKVDEQMRNMPKDKLEEYSNMLSL